MLDTALDAAAAVCLVTGALMSLAAAIGLVRFPDLLTRMHAGTKPQVLGLLLLLTAVALETRDPAVVPLVVLGWMLQLLTVPVSAHMVGRSTYRTKYLDRDSLTHDDLQKVLAPTGESEPPVAGNDAGRPDGQHTDGSAGTR